MATSRFTENQENQSRGFQEKHVTDGWTNKCTDERREGTNFTAPIWQSPGSNNPKLKHSDGIW